MHGGRSLWLLLGWKQARWNTAFYIDSRVGFCRTKVLNQSAKSKVSFRFSWYDDTEEPRTTLCLTVLILNHTFDISIFLDFSFYMTSTRSFD